MKQVKVPKDGEQSYRFALVVGDAASAVSARMGRANAAPSAPPCHR